LVVAWTTIVVVGTTVAGMKFLVIKDNPEHRHPATCI
jgi:hypothetical protein